VVKTVAEKAFTHLKLASQQRQVFTYVDKLDLTAEEFPGPEFPEAITAENDRITFGEAILTGHGISFSSPQG
jgi:hypothetical protein